MYVFLCEEGDFSKGAKEMRFTMGTDGGALRCNLCDACEEEPGGLCEAENGKRTGQREMGSQVM